VGKGSKRRPGDKKAFDENFDRIFGLRRNVDELLAQQLNADDLRDDSVRPEDVPNMRNSGERT